MHTFDSAGARIQTHSVSFTIKRRIGMEIGVCLSSLTEQLSRLTLCLNGNFSDTM